MEYFMCCLFFKIVQSKHKAKSFVIAGNYNSSLFGNTCPLFEELDQISNEMAYGRRVKIDL